MMALGAVLTGASAAAVGFVETVWQLYLAYAVMALAYGMGAAVAVGSIMSKWFIHHRAKAISLSSTGVSLGGATLVPLGTWLIGDGGLRLGAPVLGVLVVVVALPVLWLVVAAEPAEMGLLADGPGGPEAVRPEHRSRVQLDTQYRIWTREEARRTTSFWALLIGFALALATQTGVLIHQLSFLQDPDKLGSRSAAALAVTVTTIGSIVARLVVGQLIADKADKRIVTVILFLGQSAAVLLYTVVSGTVATYAVALLFGFTIGNVYMMMSLLTAEIFGILSFGTVYGVVSLAGQLGSGAGLVFMGWAHDAADGYTMPFLILAALNLVAAVVITFAHPVPSHAADVAAPVEVEVRPIG
jgi:sugar phosphate permease